MADYFAWLKDLYDYIRNPNIKQYIRAGNEGRWEGGVDLDAPGGTPVYALASGPIIGLGNFWHSKDLYTPGSGPPGYGVVTTRVNVPGKDKPQDLYYQHIDLAPGLALGQQVQKGQLLGYIHPGVNEVEVGFNADWGKIWGGYAKDHPDIWPSDPRPMLAALVGGTAPAYYSSSGSSGGIGGAIGDQITQWVNDNILPSIITFGEIAAIVIVGLTIGYFGVLVVTKKVEV